MIRFCKICFILDVSHHPAPAQRLLSPEGTVQPRQNITVLYAYSTGQKVQNTEYSTAQKVQYTTNQAEKMY